MAKQSKRMAHLSKQVDSMATLPIGEAIVKLKGLEDTLPPKIKRCRCDQSVEIAVRLGVDPKQADQIVRGSIVLPNGIGKTKTVLVFAQGANADAARAAGADYVGGKELADKIKAGWVEFDAAIATPDMMGVVGPLGKVLGPRGLMPSPRAGTVTQDVTNTVREYKAGKIEFRVDSGGNVHCVVGKLSFTEQQLTENIEALLKYLRNLKPASSKGVYMRHVTVTATFSPGINVAS
jgi:large subunit ribosomal protein L1